uniref:Uncharacterized protein n=1 Tax=Amphimedon queenslandica TaxID=400682 RepID=A0A1X7V5A6_AMPQE
TLSLSLLISLLTCFHWPDALLLLSNQLVTVLVSGDNVVQYEHKFSVLFLYLSHPSPLSLFPSPLSTWHDSDPAVIDCLISVIAILSV